MVLRTVAAACCLSATQALAGQHFICYEGIPEQRNGRTIAKVWAGCYDDSIPSIPAGRSTCSFEIDKGGLSTTPWTMLNQLPVSREVFSSIGHFSYFECTACITASGSLKLKVKFDSTPDVTKACDVTIKGIDGAADGTLTGFSSDETGLVSTGVWQRDVSDRQQVSPTVPWDFIVSGGGFVQADPQAFIRRAGYFDTQPGAGKQWVVNSSRDNSTADPRSLTAYTVGLRIHGIPPRRRPGEMFPDPNIALDELLQFRSGDSDENQQSSGNLALTHATLITAASDRVIIGGGIRSILPPIPSNKAQAIIETAPVDLTAFLCSIAINPSSLCRLSRGVQGPTAWSAVATDNGLTRTTNAVEGQILTLPISIPRSETVLINGRETSLVRWYGVASRFVESTAPRRTSRRPGQCTTVATGLRGEYAVTSAGAASVPARGSGSSSAIRLAEVVPLLNEGGAQASASRCSRNETIKAFANGIKLFPLRLPRSVRFPFSDQLFSTPRPPVIVPPTP